MEKGFIVVDVPKNCRECHLRTATGYCLPGRMDVFVYGLQNNKPDSCPIREFPAKRCEKDAYFPCDFYRTEGWNSCLKALEDATEVQNGKEDT